MNDELMAFLCECPTGLANIDDLEISKLVMENLFADGKMSPAMLLERACNSMFHDTLIARLAEMYRGHPDSDQWRYFLLAVLRNWHRWPHVHFDLKFVDEYAKVMLYHYVAKGDYRRAWDEFRKLAGAGFSVPGDDNSFSVSAGFTMEFIEVLFANMCERKMVSPLAEVDCVWHYPHARAGWKLAVSLGGHEVPGSQQLTETGSMVLKIASYFSSQRSEAKRRKHNMAARRLRRIGK